MRSIRFFGLFLPLAVITATSAATPTPASAQTALDGEWLFVLNSPMGASEIPLTIQQDGDRLVATLSVDVPEGQGFSMEGSVDGASVRFFTEVDYEGMPMEISLDGAVEDDAMSGMADYGGMAQGDWTAERAEG